MKKCFKCGNEKELTEFYKHNKMADGHLGKCKDCAKKDVLEHRQKNIDKIRAYDRERGKLPHRKEAKHKTGRKYRKEHPERRTAGCKLYRAVRVGKLKRPSQCEICGEGSIIHGHHIDYSKPLDVMWVCPVCHKKLHNQARKECP